jgi:putative transposase
MAHVVVVGAGLGGLPTAYKLRHMLPREHRVTLISDRPKFTFIIGSRNNQNFVQIPFYQLRNKLKALCERYGLVYQEQEESYTSKASALDGDDLPTYNADNPTTYPFSGKRVKRGLYRSKDGHLVNADCNGAANIGRKSKQNGFTGLSRGCLAQPLRIKIH